MKTNADFIEEIEQLCREKNLNAFDALMHYVEKYNVEPETVASVVKKNSAFKAKLFSECSELRMVR